ncbi:YHS domain-containing protein [Mesorhizobium sp. VK24D]|uniref:YHS domain-containing protein n=2 Tax=Mesorhizobium album TaxID=3072314 RepID=A0ABU4XT95_9HYPH|nr:YHS domain-containing protein [Mesorhizobium sp. VK24D]
MNFWSQNWLWILIGLGVVFFVFRGGHGFGHMRHSGYGGHHGHDGHGDGDGWNQDRRPGAVSQTVGAAVDPVSGAAVRTGSALTSLYQGRVYYFASKDNRDRFEAAPNEFAGKASGIELGGPPERPRRRGGC